MRVMIFAIASLGYALAATFVWFPILLSCGLGTDSPVACNAEADFRAKVFVAGAVAFYGVATFIYWRLRRFGVR